MNMIALQRRICCLGVALLVAGMMGAACSRTPLGNARSPNSDGSAGHMDSSRPIAAKADGLLDLRSELPPNGEPPALGFKSVSAGGFFACGVKIDGTVACWDENYGGQTVPPEGTFASVSASGWFACGVRIDGTVACWGDTKHGQAMLPAGTFASVSAGYFFACGVRTDGTVACWGDNSYGVATPPAGSFASVGAGA
jgi:hypothetical protein